MRDTDKEDEAWHRPLPRDGEWRKCTFRRIVEEGYRVQLRCGFCQRYVLIPVDEFLAETGLTLDTPIRSIDRRLRCSWCGRKRADCVSEHYGIHRQAPGRYDSAVGRPESDRPKRE